MMFVGWKVVAAACALAACGLAACSRKAPLPPPPELAWAYPKAPKADLPQVAPGAYTVPGSKITYTSQQINDDAGPPDWFPESHPAPPAVVVRERQGGPIPCGNCHLIGGQGFLGAPNLAGLPASYIKAQVLAFRSGLRRSVEPDRPATGEMIEVARKVTDTELDQAAVYFAALPRSPRFKAVESEIAPAVRPDFYGWQDQVAGQPAQPIAGRIVEVAEDWLRMQLEDPNSGVVDYVPTGAIARGEALVKTGGPGGQPCRGCHGADLKGGATAPPLAGRSAAYLARMLWDIKTGARDAPEVYPMKGPTRNLTPAQVTDISAYLVSLSP